MRGRMLGILSLTIGAGVIGFTNIGLMGELFCGANAVRIVAAEGLVAAFILGVSRAIGETMLVTVAAGATPNMTIDPRESIQTMTAYIVQLSLGETPHGTLEYNTIFAVGFLLFLMTLSMNLLGRWVVSRWAMRY